MTASTKLTSDKKKEIAEGLSKLLADSYTLYLKTQNYHWNVTGAMFQQLHALFEQQYVDLAEAVDEIAERIRALGEFAPASYSAFLKLASVKEETGHPKADAMIKQLAADQQMIADSAHALFPKVDDAGDEATADLLTRRIAVHEKNIWMLKSLLD